MTVRSLDSVHRLRYFRICNVLHIWTIRAIPTYRVYRLYDNSDISESLQVNHVALCTMSHDKMTRLMSYHVLQTRPLHHQIKIILVWDKTADLNDCHYFLINSALNAIVQYLCCFVFTDELHKVVNETNKLLKAKVPELKKSLTLYLANEETEHILFRPCRVSVDNIFFTCRQLNQYCCCPAKSVLISV